MFIEVWDCRHLSVSFWCAAVMFANITLLKFWMYKNEAEKNREKKRLGLACTVLGFFSVCLFVVFFPITTISAAVDESVAKMCRQWEAESHRAMGGFQFSSGWSEPCRKRKSWLVSANSAGLRPHVLTVHVALGMLWLQNEFGQLTWVQTD